LHPCDLLHQLIHRLVVEFSDGVEDLGTLANPLSQSVGHPVAEQKQLVLVGFQFTCELVDELHAGKVAEVQTLVFDLGNVRDAHIETISQLFLGPTPLFPKLSNTSAKLHLQSLA